MIYENLEKVLFGRRSPIASGKAPAAKGAVVSLVSEQKGKGRRGCVLQRLMKRSNGRWESGIQVETPFW